QGVKRTGVDIVAQDLEFLTPKPTDEYGDEIGQERHVRTANDYIAPPQQQSFYGNKKPQLQTFDDDSDIPF
ncbi:MAG: hypothetical protein K2K80_05700, partial [Clostridia bacterium]|nr:hypothetical protein [Clostridia bacterium]